MSAITRRSLLQTSCAAFLSTQFVEGAQPGTITIQRGDLTVTFRDNSRSPQILSGLDSMVHRAAPDFDAFDPEGRGASAGLNFEHIISGHRSPSNSFTPRKGPFSFLPDTSKDSVTLVRRKADSPWAVSCELKYTVVAPHYIDFQFSCIPHDAGLFGPRGYAIFFFANYMNDVDNIGLHFRGIEKRDGPEKWIVADAPNGHKDWNRGGTYRSHLADDLQYDDDHNFKLNSWSYDYPRFTQPFYFGRAAQGMVFQQMFDRMYTEIDEIRFSLFKFKLPRRKRTAWDFQYVIRKLQTGEKYGFRGRLVWKKLISSDDCLNEYRNWAANLSLR